MKTLNVEPFSGFEHLVKDTHSKSITNSDKKAYEAYVSKRDKANKEEIFKYNTQSKIQSMQSDINTIKSDLSDIKGLLLSLANKEK